jgi:hypothetical protein
MGNGNDMAGGGGGGDKHVFVTKLKYASTTAPTVCQNAAESAGLGGTWVPWLSNIHGTENAIDKITARGPWKLVTGEVAFANRGQIGSTPSVPIDVAEDGSKLAPEEEAWTATLTGGTRSTWHCSYWESSS